MGLKDVDGRSDQFALGQILYEMLTGTRAHAGENQFEVLHNIATGKLYPPRQRRPDLPVALEQILLRMLAFAPADRYPTLLLAGQALLPYADDQGARDPGERLQRSRRRRPSARPLAAPPRRARFRPGTRHDVSGDCRRAGRRTQPRGRAATGAARSSSLSSRGSASPAASFSGSAVVRRRPAPTAAPVPVALGVSAGVNPARASTRRGRRRLNPEPSTCVSFRRGRRSRSTISRPFRAICEPRLPAGDHAAHVLRMSAPGHRPREISFGPDTAPPAADHARTPRGAGRGQARQRHGGTHAPHAPSIGGRAGACARDARFDSSRPGAGPNDALIIH